MDVSQYKNEHRFCSLKKIPDWWYITMSMLNDQYKVQNNICTRFCVSSFVCVLVSVSMLTKRIKKRLCKSGTLLWIDITIM
jgi:hypothetical protein